MNREQIRDYQLAQLEILKKVDEICRTKEIKYFLVWGSLLGAVRHKGFIPWDADIDIAMYRPDYERFCSTFDQSEGNPLFLDSYQTDKNHMSPHALIRIKGTHIIENKDYHTTYSGKYDGIYLDIFPLDNVSAETDQQQKQIRKLLKLRKLGNFKRAKTYGEATSCVKTLAKKMISNALRPVSWIWINKKIDQISQEFNESDTGYIAMLADPDFYPKQTFQKELFGRGREGSFEGYTFTVPEQAEKILSIAYGDYMQFPPEEQRYSFLEGEIDHIDYGIYGDNLRL